MQIVVQFYLQINTHTIEAGCLPAGPAIFEAVTHNGFESSTSEPVSVDISSGSPSVAIIHPFHHQTLEYGGTMQFHGMVSDELGDPVDADECYWLVDDKTYTQGLESYVRTPSPGLHKVSLVVKGKFGSCSAESEIMIIENDYIDDN